jgi:hypothetical protein
MVARTSEPARDRDILPKDRDMLLNDEHFLRTAEDISHPELHAPMRDAARHHQIQMKKSIFD